MIRWYKTSEKRPKNNSWVYVCIDDNGTPQCVGTAKYNKGKWYDENDEERNVDRWMPIPSFNAGKAVYLAAPMNTPKDILGSAKGILEEAGFDVYCPSEHYVEHAWEYPNSEWGLMVFQADIEAIKRSDYVVMLSYGRLSTAGSNWEAGYAFGLGKKVIVVEEFPNGANMSVMVANGRYATVEGLAGLEAYDWYKMEPARTKTEQK